MLRPKPGTRESRLKGYTCVPMDQVANIDVAGETVFGPSQGASCISVWNTDGCPLHDKRTRVVGQKYGPGEFIYDEEFGPIRVG